MCLFPGVCSHTAPNLNSGLLAPPDPRAPLVKTASLDWILFSRVRLVWRLDSITKGLQKSLNRKQGGGGGRVVDDHGRYHATARGGGGGGQTKGTAGDKEMRDRGGFAGRHR